MSKCEAEVMKINRKLQKMIDGIKTTDDAPDLLDALSSLPIDFEVLTNTRIGLTLNELRKKTSDEKLAKRVKSLIKEWKNVVEKKGKPTNSQSKDSLQRRDSHNSDSNHSVSASAESGGSPLKSKEIRSKSAQMLLSALRFQEMPNGTLDPEELAVKIEQKLFEVHKGADDKYRAALRSRVFNLRDKKNVALRENVLTGVVSAEKFAVMTSEEMASPEIKLMREKFSQEAINEHQMSTLQGTPSDMFKCGKCGKKRTTYSQLQTRSSDEPMTTFVYCLECGNRWKFC